MLKIESRCEDVGEAENKNGQKSVCSKIRKRGCSSLGAGGELLSVDKRSAVICD